MSIKVTVGFQELNKELLYSTTSLSLVSILSCRLIYFEESPCVADTPYLILEYVRARAKP
jgi:hypothetical protein